jgi:hypothetical protein
MAESIRDKTQLLNELRRMTIVNPVAYRNAAGLLTKILGTAGDCSSRPTPPDIPRPAIEQVKSRRGRASS